MNEPNLESIKRHLEQLKSQLTKINSYHGWLNVRTDDGIKIFEDVEDSELSTLIKKQIQKNINFWEERLKVWEKQLKERQNEAKS